MRRSRRTHCPASKIEGAKDSNVIAVQHPVNRRHISLVFTVTNYLVKNEQNRPFKGLDSGE